MSASLAAVGFALLDRHGGAHARAGDHRGRDRDPDPGRDRRDHGAEGCVMPPVMQQACAELSPFSWGLEGFLDLFVRGGGVREVLPEAGQLLAFGAAC
ncbi:MAG: hypothetical protein MZW92_50865, partial [Comamonadaceae bacterium]|nr:hypothetical protein [Comamonadaceae bacterium]